ncbi:putative transferase [Helianthus annuus]|nr:putative transferase [Helianthus annuus]KAJ0955480.1 putative transferase [Helianthus annuus]
MICNHVRTSISQIPIKFHLLRRRPQKEKVLVVLGVTGAGKSRLSVDLATRFTAEVVNSDKIQMYQGLDITTNKITYEECNGVPHHLIGIIPPEADFTAKDFVRTSSLAIESIIGRGKRPIIAGGSNSFIEALIDDRSYEFRSRYDVCFLWVDVAMPVLKRFVSDRVDRMVAAGMVEEVRKMYNPNSDYSKGIRRAIGVPEFDSYFRSEYSSSINEETRAKLLESAINDVKINTCALACQQLKKIDRLRNVKGWDLHRIDATKVFENTDKYTDDAWSELVRAPATAIVSQFIRSHSCIPTTVGESVASNRFADSVIREYERRAPVTAAESC